MIYLFYQVVSFKNTASKALYSSVDLLVQVEITVTSIAPPPKKNWPKIYTGNTHTHTHTHTYTQKIYTTLLIKFL